MILEIDIDGSGKVTVRGKRGHVWNANGNTPLKWQGKPGSDISEWTVTFDERSPFEGDKLSFGAKASGADGGKLKSHEGPEERYHYDVTCTKNGTEHNSDPEIVLWPN